MSYSLDASLVLKWKFQQYSTVFHCLLLLAKAICASEKKNYVFL